MAEYLVSHVKKEPCGDGVHRHIEGVCLYSSKVHYTRAAVVASINSGNMWYTHVNGAKQARIRPITRCPRCSAAPYITTRADNEVDNNLDNLPEC